MGLFDKNTTRTRKGLFSTENDPNSLDSINRQISNASVRVQDAGYTPEESDQRNSFEKWANLPEKQNWFFDTLEILGRPLNAVKNVIDKTAVNNSETFGTALKRGFSGKDKVSGADLAEHMGVENKVGKFLLGTGIDVALDPITYIPGGAIAKGIKGTAGVVAKPIKAGYSALENASPALKTLRETKLQPATESVKDGLGFMFNPDYKKTETLFGTQDDFLKKLETDTESSRRFMKENNMTALADTAKLAGGVDKGIDVGRVMEQNVEVTGPRPFREMPADPNVLHAADNLMKTNAEIRQFAADKGIDIPELAGYMTHILTQEEKARKSAGKSLKIDAGRFGLGNPNKSILKQRKLAGSAEDINQEVGRDFFQTNAFFATGIGQQRLIDYVHAVDFRRKVMSNPSFAQKYDKGMDIGKNVVIDSNNYKFLKDSGDTLEGMKLADNVGGEYVVTPQAKMLLDRYQRANTDEGSKAFMKAFDTIQGTWKKFALFSIGFHVRNSAGALWNNYLAGMNPAQLVKYTIDGAKEVTKAARGKESELFKEYRAQGLGSTGLTKVEYGSVREPEKAIQKTIENRSKDTKGIIKQRLNPINAFQTSSEVGDFTDQVHRFALYRYARGKGMSPQDAAAKVKESQFDYTRLTPFEQKARRLIPFYAWSRNNIPYQIKKFIEDPRRFQNINKVRINAQEAVGLDENNIPDYMKEQFSLPLYGNRGKGKMLGLNLPLGDLTKLSDPLKLGADSLTPFIKTPLELATNFNFFKRKPIEKFEGQEKKFAGGLGIPIKTAYALEQATGQIGRGLSDYLQKPDNVDQANKFSMPSFGISSFAKDFDADKFAYYKQLDELKKLQELLLYIKQQEGQKPRTLAEIKKGSR